MVHMSQAYPFFKTWEQYNTNYLGIIGMEYHPDIGFGLVGVAPEASLFMHRIFSCGGIGTTDIILATMQRAADCGVDITNMSITLGQDWPTELGDPLRQMIVGLVKKGIVVIAGNGNSG